MRNLRVVLVVVLAVCSIGRCSLAEDSSEDQVPGEWAAEIHGGEQVAREVAGQNGYDLVREVKSLPDHYILRRSIRARRSAGWQGGDLATDTRVAYVARQTALERKKRGLAVLYPEDRHETRRVTLDRIAARAIAASTGQLHDPKLKDEWYINNEDTTDHGVRGCWRRNITGKGVVVTIIDDGLERDHPDISINYDPKASYDLNDDDEDPYPRYEITNENKHGTRCAGVVAMVANNNNCGTGIAFDARIGGVRVLDGKVTDRSESEAFAWNPTHVDIYSVSWGPTDNGKTMDAPKPLSYKAIERGIREGRGGKGSLYAWASGDGGHRGDSCFADGYLAMVYTISISSASQGGLVPFYGEKCASSMATTYSSGYLTDQLVTSTDLHHGCTNQHSGTSASAPMAAGMLALLLEQNPSLTWRDVQHVVAYTSVVGPLAKEKGWYKNGAGFCVNLAFGHGLMNAEAMVDLADPATWVNVGEQHVCKVKVGDAVHLPLALSTGGKVEVNFTTDGCQDQVTEVNYLEHVQLLLHMNYTRRGNLYAELRSPMGTITPIIMERSKDSTDVGYQNVTLMSVHTWGEQPEGTWTFTVTDKTSRHDHGSITGVVLVLYGTERQPQYMADHGAKACDAPRTPAVKEKVPKGSSRTSGIRSRYLLAMMGKK